MIEPPSQKLLERLTALQLCRRGDLRRCRRRVHRLARDLPAFDSVWIDALLQGRQLTPFQAQLLESPQPERLTVGPCVLVDELGSGPGGTTYLARIRDGKQRCVLKIVRSPVPDVETAHRRLETLLASLQGEVHPHVVAPHHVVVHDGELVLLSRLADGVPLNELLIRRGRFPAAVVLEIGKQMIAGLAFLESKEVVHGDVSLRNVRLAKSGRIVLTDAGVAPAVRPEVLINADLPPERFDGVAPERVATAAPATTASDMYALGCLLWELLAGRPPFPTGDPLTKLAQHQTGAVDDIREWVPDCPARLADSIAALTAHDSAARPSSFGELAARSGGRRRSGRRRLRKFHGSFQTAVSRRRRPFPGSGLIRRVPLAAAALFGIAVTLGVVETDLRQPLLNLAAPITAPFGLADDDSEPRSSDKSSAAPADGAAVRGIPLPPPDADGVIHLTTDGPYLWDRPLRARREIAIRGEAGRHPLVLVNNNRAAISARRVVLKNVRVRTAGESRVAVRSVSLHVEQCRFQKVGLAWQSPRAATRGRSDAAVTQLRCQDVIFSECPAAVDCNEPPRVFRCDNVLQLGGGALLRFGELPESGRAIHLKLDRVTQRNATALLELALSVGDEPRSRVLVTARNCVFHYGRPDAALCRFAKPFPGPLPGNVVQFSGEGSLIPPGAAIAAETSPSPRSANRENEAVLIDGGLLSGPFEFAGPYGDDPAASVVKHHRAPLRTAAPPGVNAKTLPPLPSQGEMSARRSAE